MYGQLILIHGIVTHLLSMFFLFECLVITKLLTLCSFIKDIQADEPVSFQHIKRIRKNSHSGLTAIICSHEMLQTEEDFLRLLKDAEFEYENTSGRFQVPRLGPSTKELSSEWSEKYWPLVWRGNPNDQILNDYVFDMGLIKGILQRISELTAAQHEKDPLITPAVSAFVNPLNKRVIYTVDGRHQGSPLDHSIMLGIKEVARQEQQRRDCGTEDPTQSDDPDTYLCLDFDVYTSHEPCSMCAMALIHSRIKRCIFLKSMACTGCLTPASGDGYCMHNNRNLNSSYEVFQWTGNEFIVPHIDPHTCC